MQLINLPQWLFPRIHWCRTQADEGPQKSKRIISRARDIGNLLGCNKSNNMLKQYIWLFLEHFCVCYTVSLYVIFYSILIKSRTCNYVTQSCDTFAVVFVSKGEGVFCWGHYITADIFCLCVKCENVSIQWKQWCRRTIWPTLEEHITIFISNFV